MRSDEELVVDNLKKPSENKPLLKDQLKKKTIENNDFIGKSRSDHTSNIDYRRGLNNFNNVNSLNKDKESSVSLNSKPKSSATSLTDTDWTELLSVPSKKAVPGGNKSGIAVLSARSPRRDGNVKGNLGLRPNVVALDGKKIQRGQTRVVKSDRRSGLELDSKFNGGGLDGRLSDVGDVTSRTSTSSSGIESRNSEESGERGERSDFDLKNLNTKVANENKDEGFKGSKEASDGSSNEGQLQSKDNLDDARDPSNTELSTFDGKQEPKAASNDAERPNIAVDAVDGSRVGSRISASSKKSSSLSSDEESDSGTDSASSSDSESEREREERKKQRQQILAEKAAAKATEAIKERENAVARLEGEKQSLEKILEERAKQQALEVNIFQLFIFSSAF